MPEDNPYQIHEYPRLRSASLVIGWNEDAGKLGVGVVDYLNQKLGGRAFAEIDPAGFFPLGGVSVSDDVAEFPENQFSCCEERDLVLFKSNLPRFEWHRYLNAILDVAERYCTVKEVYTVGAMVALRPHTAPRELLTVANSPEIKGLLRENGAAGGMSFETPPGQRPTLSAFLLWVAKRRGLAGANLWVPVPFYLTSTEDPEAWKRAATFLDRRFRWALDLSDLDERVARQHQRIARARSRFPEIDRYIGKLEHHVNLTDEETQRLAKIVEEVLGRGD